MMGGQITPFRMNQLMEVASKVTKMMVTGVWHLSFDEMEIVLGLVRCGMDESMEMNKRGDNRDVLENRRNEKDHEVQS